MPWKLLAEWGNSGEFWRLRSLAAKVQTEQRWGGLQHAPASAHDHLGARNLRHQKLLVL